MIDETHERVGACHCGRVRIRVPSDATGIVACHCSDCQKLHGNFFAMIVAERARVRWEGEAEVRWYRSSTANERAFCGHCGSRLAKRPIEGTKIMVSAGLFEGEGLPRVVRNLWLEQKPAWYEPPRVGPIRPEDFVTLALADPIESATAQYGYALRAASGNPRPPGVVALTWITARDPDERERIRSHARRNVEDFLAEPGFVSIVTGFTGLRGFTVTAWEDEAAMKAALAKHHAEARAELFEQDFVASVWTSVWKPARINRIWVRCPACASLEDTSDAHEACARCGARLPERPAFW
jgi:hypothetical protein